MVRRSLPTEDVTLAPTLRRAEDDLSVACSSLAQVFVRGVNVRWSALDSRTAAFEPRRPLFETRR
jgi:acyl transferase domain-containing protein